jgi:hypothetical protein
MKYLCAFFAILVLIAAAANYVLSSDQTSATQPAEASQEASSDECQWQYPIAPGVWYPGQPLPEHPIRYYRMRCWPGCHSGSDYGMYPDRKLDMKPIHSTSPLRNQSGTYQPAEQAKTN